MTMIMYKAVAAACLAIAVAAVDPDPSLCSVRIPDGDSFLQYDLKELANTQVQVDTPDAPKFYFKFTFCGNLPDEGCPNNAKHPSIETYAQYQGCRRGLGLLQQTTLDPLPDGSRGVQVTYKDDNPTPACTGSLGERGAAVTTLNVRCDESVDTYEVKTVEFPTEQARPCRLTVTLASKHACPKVLKPTGGGDSGDGIGGGWIFLTILAVGSVLYLTGGIVYKKSVKGAAGAEMLPNVDFWREFFASVAEGAVITWYALTCRTRPGNEGDIYHGIEKLPGEEEGQGASP